MYQKFRMFTRTKSLSRFGEPKEAGETSDIVVAHGVHKQLQFF
jgi:hypothetical protein